MILGVLTGGAGLMGGLAAAGGGSLAVGGLGIKGGVLLISALGGFSGVAFTKYEDENCHRYAHDINYRNIMMEHIDSYKSNSGAYILKGLFCGNLPNGLCSVYSTNGENIWTGNFTDGRPTVCSK